MKSPANIESLSTSNLTEEMTVAYPPLGFLPVYDAELGNGDYFGLYWPYGRENEEPIVCDMIHDEWTLEIAFSNSSVFEKWLELNDHERGDEEVDDPTLVSTRFNNLKPFFKDKPEEAIIELNKICEDFPESSEYWFSLASQLRRVGKHEDAFKAAIRCFASNWIFGSPPNGVLGLLRNAKGKLNDPIVNCADQLSLNFGGAKENDNYLLLRKIIDEYLTSESPILGLILNQNYGYVMSTETGSFQERYDYKFEDWFANHKSLCKQFLGDERVTCAR